MRVYVVDNIDDLPDYLEIWIAEAKVYDIVYLALVCDQRRSYEEGELYEIIIVVTNGVELCQNETSRTE